MEEKKEILVNIDIKGKGTIENKTMKVNGRDITIEGLAGAWFWIKNEGCFRIGDDVYHTGDYDPNKEVVCSIVMLGEEAVNNFKQDRVLLNNLEFEKFIPGGDATEDAPAQSAGGAVEQEEPQPEPPPQPEPEQDFSAEEPPSQEAQPEPPQEDSLFSQPPEQPAPSLDDLFGGPPSQETPPLDNLFPQAPGGEAPHVQGFSPPPSPPPAKNFSLPPSPPPAKNFPPPPVQNFSDPAETAEPPAQEGPGAGKSPPETKEEILKLKTELERIKQESENALADKSSLENEIEKLKHELTSQVDGYESEIEKLKGEVDVLKKDIEETGEVLEERNRKEEEYERELEMLKLQVEDLQNENRLTIETYEKTLADRRKTFANVSKWMSKVSGVDEKANVKEKVAQIEKLIHERTEYMEELKKLKPQAIKSAAKKPAKHEATDKTPPSRLAPTPAPPPPELSAVEQNDLCDSFTYIVISTFILSKGNRVDTVAKLDRIMETFNVVDPKKEGITLKDLLIIKDFQNYIAATYEESGMDMGTIMNFFKDEIDKILDRPEISDPGQRVTFRQDMRDAYDRYRPKSSR